MFENISKIKIIYEKVVNDEFVKIIEINEE